MLTMINDELLDDDFIEFYKVFCKNKKGKYIFKKQLTTMFWNFYADMIKEGLVAPRGKSEKEIIEEMADYTPSSLDSIITGDKVITWVLDYRDSLLCEARLFVKNKKYDIASIMYATFIEHWINKIITTLCQLKEFSRKEVNQIIRNVNIEGKFTWLLKLLGGKKIYTTHFKKIMQLIECRNQFIHYKWKGEENFFDDKWEKKFEGIIHDIEKPIKYLQYYENKYILGNKSALISKVAERAAEYLVVQLEKHVSNAG